MIDPPALLDGARVLLWADVSDREPTGHVVHYAGGARQDHFDALAIAQYDNAQQGEAYLFHCDATWCVLNDDWFATVDDAITCACEQYGVERAELHDRRADLQRGRTRG
jgi:hypothetical protein